MAISNSELISTRPTQVQVDVLCIGHASYDLVFSVPGHPDKDEKIVADNFISCGGGPAANAAVMVSKLGFSSAFAGYLGEDLYGDKHWQELLQYRIATQLIIRGASPTPVSTVLVKPDGKRALVNYKGNTQPLPANAIDFTRLQAKTILFDGHEPHISTPLAQTARKQGIPMVLDAGSVHQGTLALMQQVDYLVCSEKFARHFAEDQTAALKHLAQIAPTVVITLGEKGLIWQRGSNSGTLPAFAVDAVDTTGAGDAFHGAFAAALCINPAMDWLDILRYASAAGTLCCTQTGARQGLPSQEEHQEWFKRYKDAGL